MRQAPTQAAGLPTARGGARSPHQLQARRRRDEREAQRQIHERAERVAEPRNDDGPLPRID